MPGSSVMYSSLISHMRKLVAGRWFWYGSLNPQP
jgi:hypothetical protein